LGVNAFRYIYFSFDDALQPEIDGASFLREIEKEAP
jgi:hypothetical protein